jgi:ring-1,2-phenylacetyl-CoA epoxidase subunit PaaD
VTLEAAARAAVATVDDPEMPGVSIVELGLLESITVVDGAVTVGLIPTFSGCPALALIARRVEEAVAGVDDVRSVTVEFLRSPVWTIERVSSRARRDLSTNLGIAVERKGSAECPRCATRTEMRSMFGPTRCRAVHHCPSCGEVVEVMR